MDLIKLKDQCLSYFVDSKIVPLAPGPIVAKLFLFVFAVQGFNLLELFHKLEVNCCNFLGVFKG